MPKVAKPKPLKKTHGWIRGIIGFLTALCTGFIPAIIAIFAIQIYLRKNSNDLSWGAIGGFVLLSVVLLFVLWVIVVLLGILIALVLYIALAVILWWKRTAVLKEVYG